MVQEYGAIPGILNLISRSEFSVTVFNTLVFELIKLTLKSSIYITLFGKTSYLNKLAFGSGCSTSNPESLVGN